MGIIQELQLELQAKDKSMEKFQNGEEVEEKQDSTMQRRPSSTTDAQTLTEVCIVSDSPCSSHQDVDVYFSEFEKYAQGIGFKLLTKMGFDGKYLGINGQGMTNPIQVEEIPRCKVWDMVVGEFSKTIEAKEASREEPNPLHKLPIQGYVTTTP
jgi:hypothetical protein